MKILIVGFQRSGTTLMRRLLQLHPQVIRVFHEQFLLKTCNSKQDLFEYVQRYGINPKKNNWGEKVPYFPSARKYPIVKYCQKWEDYFGNNSKILHVVRHPYDVAISNVNKFRNIKSIDTPIKIYKKIIPNAVTEIDKLKSTLTFKYEDLLLNSDEMMFKVYEHCGLNPDFDYKKKMLTISNPRYQKINSKRAFAHKKQNIKGDYKLRHIIEILNKIEGPEYEL